MKIAVIDVETTGLDPNTDRIVEIAAVILDYADSKPSDSAPGPMLPNYPNVTIALDTLVNPQCPIPAQAAAVHHITHAMVRDAPTWRDVSQQLEHLTGGCTFAAHNAKFDSSFVAPDHIGEWICTMRVARHLWPAAPGFGNQILRYALELDPQKLGIDPQLLSPPHRALPDAIVTAHLLDHQLAHHAQHHCHPHDPIEWALALTHEPVRLKTVPFGRYFGAQWQNVPRDYLDWCTTRSWDDPDLVYTINEAAAGRFA